MPKFAIESYSKVLSKRTPDTWLVIARHDNWEDAKAGLRRVLDPSMASLTKPADQFRIVEVS